MKGSRSNALLPEATLNRGAEAGSPAGMIAPGPADPSPSFTWRERRVSLLVILCVAGAASGWGGSQLSRPVYRAKAVLEVQGSRMAPPNGETTRVVPSPDPIASFVETQARLLESSTVLERAVGKMRHQFPPPDAESLNAEVLKSRDALAVKVAGTSQLIEVLYDAFSPQEAAGFANAVSDAFVELTSEEQRTITRRVAAILASQLAALKSKLEMAEQALQAHMERDVSTPANGPENVDDARLNRLQSELSAAQSQRMLKQSMVEQAAASSSDTLPGVMDDAALNTRREKITGLRQQIGELTATLTPAHYRVQALQAKLDVLERDYAAARQNTLQRIRNEFEAAQRREELVASAFQEQLRALPGRRAREFQSASLQRDVDLHRQLYERILQRVTEAQVFSSLHAGSARVVDAARPPARPHSPDLWLNSGIGAAGGLLVGAIILTWGRRTARAIPSVHGPRVLPGADSLDLTPVAHTVRILAASPLAIRESAYTLEQKHPYPVCPESLREIVQAVLSRGTGSPPLTLVVTSPDPGEGKTAITASIGSALAGSGRRTLLIDGDMRRPNLHRVFRLNNYRGLTDLLQGEDVTDLDLSRCVLPTHVPDLYLLPGGTAAAAADSLLLRPQIDHLLTKVERWFPVILIDTPPSLQVLDARLFAKRVDGVLLVLCSGLTTQGRAVEARQAFERDGSAVLGTVVNDMRQDRLPVDCQHAG